MLVFKVKERGVDTFSTFVSEELNNGPSSLSYDNVFGVISDNLPQAQKDFLKKRKAEYTKGLYVSDDIGVAGNTYNWPYDYFSLVELAQIESEIVIEATNAKRIFLLSLRYSLYFCFMDYSESLSFYA